VGSQVVLYGDCLIVRRVERIRWQIRSLYFSRFVGGSGRETRTTPGRLTKVFANRRAFKENCDG
jgi:hypothetical protein